MATREFDLKIVNARKVSFALMSCDVAIGYRTADDQFVGLFTVPDFILKKSPTKGYFFSAPSKPYMKDGVHQEKDGYKQYLEFFKLYMEKGADQNDPSKYSPTKAAFEARKWLIGKMVDAMKAIGIEDSDAPAPRARAAAPAARGTTAQKPRAQARPDSAKAAVDEAEIDSPLDEDDDDLPF